MAADLDAFFNTDEFADSATYNGATINGIFTDAFQLSTVGGMETSSPQFETKTSSVSSAAHRDTLVINSVTYYVIGIQPSEDGLTTVLILSKD
jgi:hypothetical protein